MRVEGRRADGPLRLAVLGAGMAGQSHLLDAVTRPDFEVVALCSRREAASRSVADDFGIRAVYTDLERMLEDERPDAVVVATPPCVLAAHAALCLRSGADVLVEKPMAARGEAEIRDLVSAREESGQELVVAYNRRYRAAWSAARDWLAAGRIGALQAVHYLWSGPYSRRFAPDAATYRADRNQRMGGVMLDLGCHALDGLAYLTGRPATIRHAHLEFDARSGADVSGVVRLLQEGGTAITLVFQDSLDTEVDTSSIRVKGERGTITIDGRHARMDTSGGKPIVIEDCYHRRPIDDLLALRRKDAVCGASVQEASETLRCVLAVYRRSQARRLPWKRPRAKALARRSGAC